MVVVFALVAGLLVYVYGGLPERAKFNGAASKADREAAEALREAALDLTQLRGVKYTGTYVHENTEVSVEAQVTNAGWTLATLGYGGYDVELLSNGPHTYVRGDKEFWSDYGASDDELDAFASNWVRISPEDIGIDFARLFAPGALGADLDLAVTRYEASKGKETEVDGVAAIEVLTPFATVYVTREKPHRILQLAGPKEKDDPEDGGQGGGAGFALIPAHQDGDSHVRRTEVTKPGYVWEYRLNILGLSDEELETLFAELETRVNSLRTALDSHVRFNVDGNVTFNPDPCGQTECTAIMTLSNEVEVTHEYVRAGGVTAVIEIKISLDDKLIKTCKVTKTMPANGSTSASCRATYTLPADGLYHTLKATAHAVARATADADIVKLFNEIKREIERKRPVSLPGKDGDLGPDWMPCSVHTIPLPQGACEEKTKEIHEKIGGAIKQIRPGGQLTDLGSYRGFDTDWELHEVVVKNGRVYDAWTGQYGEPIDVYKSRWYYRDLLYFTF